MAEGYFEQLNKDYWADGIDTGHSVDMPVTTYDEAFKIIAAPTGEDPNINETPPATVVGKRTREIWQRGMRFGIGNFACCETAEISLLRTVRKKSENYAERQPIVLTRNDKPVALVKQDGERTAYVLSDIPAIELFKGMFAAPKNVDTLYYSTLPKVAHPWKVDITEFPEGFIPMRFSLFSTPRSARTPLYTPSKAGCNVLRTYHSNIAAAAHRLLPLTMRATFEKAGLVPDKRSVV